MPHALPSTGHIRVVLQVAGNDADSDKSASAICNQYSDLIRVIKLHNSEAEITVVGIPPRKLSSRSKTESFSHKIAQVNHYLSTRAFFNPANEVPIKFVSACPNTPGYFDGGKIKIHFNEDGKNLYAQNLHLFLSKQ